MSDDTRRVRFRGADLGDLPLDRLATLATRGEIDGTAEFWSEREQAWRPLAGILVDFHPSPLDDMRAAGVEHVEILGSGPDDCPACRAIQNKRFPIAAAPSLPPEGCACVPWCRCVEIAAE